MGNEGSLELCRRPVEGVASRWLVTFLIDQAPSKESPVGSNALPSSKLDELNIIDWLKKTAWLDNRKPFGD